MGKIHLGPYTIKTSNENKILFPESKITKGALIDYYNNIGSLIIPHTKDRAISMVRYPDGIQTEGFFQKEAGSYFPDWIKTKKIKKQDGYTNYVVINNKATLVYLANQACIAPHIWLSKIDKLNYPDKIIFDLDPSTKDFSMIQETAILLKKKIEHLGLTPFAMITGSRGIHVIIPIKRKYIFDTVRKFAQDIAKILVMEHPNLVTIEIRKEKRKNLVFIDTLRNAFGQTTVAPYGVRSKKGAPVATPITWKEVENASLRPDKYTIKNIFQRLDKIDNPWKDIFKKALNIDTAQKQIKKMLK